MLKIVHSCNIFNGNESYPQTDAKLKSPLETRQHILHALAASCMKSYQLFANTLPEQLFE
jgi:hypothetical protein